MTILEKIKRCVSLVWDFQEIYDGEDIEDFCHNELHTYPQHDEIMEYFKRIENLEKNNEWHYVRDELPKEKGEYFVAIKTVLYDGSVKLSIETKNLVQNKHTKKWSWYDVDSVSEWEDNDFHSIYAWKEIIPPREKLPQNCKEFGKCIYSRCPCDKFEFN